MRRPGEGFEKAPFFPRASGVASAPREDIPFVASVMSRGDTHWDEKGVPGRVRLARKDPIFRVRAARPGEKGGGVVQCNE